MNFKSDSAEELAAVEELTGIKKSQCGCSTCQQMCTTAPCIGTPQDIFKLIEAGYAGRLKMTRNHAFERFRLKAIEIIMPEWLEDEKRCTFFVDGKCELHDKGLKPMEGKLAIHTDDPEKIPILTVLGMAWLCNPEQVMELRELYQDALIKDIVGDLFGDSGIPENMKGFIAALTGAEIIKM